MNILAKRLEEINHDLLTGAGLLIRSMLAIRAVGPGIDEESSVRCEPDRPADLHRDRLTADVCRLTCLLHSGATRDKGGPSDGVTTPMSA